MLQHFFRCSALARSLGSHSRIVLSEAKQPATSHSFDFVKVETHAKVGLIKLNRPKAFNALSSPLMAELSQAITELDWNANIGCIVLTGSDRAFAAGADIKEMSDLQFMDAYKNDFITSWETVSRVRKPVVAAVNGFALGGGCELAMMCDIIIAGKSAKFGQPEVKLGTIPGAGGTVRTTKSIGKAKAMDLCLTGRFMDADEAERCGLVSRVVDDDKVVSTALQVAETIASYSKPIVMMIKESINASNELPLREGMRLERRMFHSTFATHDQKEGMKAFSEKRPANFTDS